MHQVAIFSSNSAFVKLWSGALSDDYHVVKALNLTELKGISIVIIDSVQIDNAPELINHLSQAPYRSLVVGKNWPESKQVNALVHGAAGYCEETEPPKVLLLAVTCVLKGDSWIQRHLVPLVIGTLVKMKPPSKDTSTSPALLETLSKRENDVANMIKDGKSNKIIASELYISERTVKAHLTSIFKKLNLSDRLHLALYIKEHR